MIDPGKEPRWRRYCEMRDWLVAIGVCAACGLALALWLTERETAQPALPLPCRLPKWRQQKCLDLVRNEWTTRPQERRAA